MKTLVIALGFLFAFSLSACEQEKTPEKVKATFNLKYPNAKEVGWDMEEKNEWEAEFEMDEKEMSATFDQSGKWLETETEIEGEDLPAPVKETLKTQFNDYKVEEAEYVESPQYKGYEIELEGKKDIEVVIAKNGQVIKKETGDEDDD